MAAGFRLGIDFGTSHTVGVLRWPDGQVKSLLFEGSELLPSAVCAADSGAGPVLLAGRDAMHAAWSRPECFEPTPKRRVDDGTVLLGEAEVDVAELISAVLGRVAGEARRVAGDVPPTVLTFPAGWGAYRQATLLAAARLAGLGEPDLVAEPVAAAAHFVQAGATVPVGTCAVIYDFGAGTFDASVVRRTADGYTVLATEGLADAGGLDIDAAIVAFLAAMYAGPHPEEWARLRAPSTTGDRRAARQLWDQVRAAKEMLSRAASTTVHLPLVERDVILGREQLDQLALPVVERTVTATRAAINTAGVGGIEGGAIAGLFLVGGSSRFPLAATLLHRSLRLAPVVLERPELVVAEGSLYAQPDPAPQPQPDPVRLPTEGASTVATPIATMDTEAANQASTGAPRGGDRMTPMPTPADDPELGQPDPDTEMWPSVPDTAEPTLGPVEHPAGRRKLQRWLAVGSAVALLVAAGITAALTRSLWSNAGSPCHTPSATTLTSIDITVSSLAFSPNCRTLATGQGDGTVGLWDLSTGRQSATIDRDPHSMVRSNNIASIVYAVAFSPTDPNTLATGGDDYKARLRDVATGNTKATLSGHTGVVTSVAFSPDGKQLATGSYDNTVRLWDVATGAPIATLTGHTNSVRSVAFNPKDPNILASASDDNTVQLWNVSTRQSTTTLPHPDYVRTIAFSPNGTTLATGGFDKTVRLWNVSTGQVTKTLTNHTQAIDSVAFSPDGRTVASADGRKIQLWDTTTGATFAIDDRGSCVAFSPDSAVLATCHIPPGLWNIAQAMHS